MPQSNSIFQNLENSQPPIFTLSEIAKRTGIPRRILDHWADPKIGRVLERTARADSSRDGYDEKEMLIAAILKPLIVTRMPVQVLADAARGLRIEGFCDLKRGVPLPRLTLAISAARRGAPTWMGIRWTESASLIITQGVFGILQAEEFATQIKERDFFTLQIIDLRAALKSFPSTASV